MRTLSRLLILFLVVALGATMWLTYGLVVPKAPSQETFVLLRPGSSTRRIANELKKAGIIRSEDAFLLWHYFGHKPSLKAGEYRFDVPASAITVHARIAVGDVYKHTVVVPEGFNMFEIADAVQAAGLGTRDEFLQAARDHVSLISDVDPQAKSLEGYLFPDTYQFTRTQSMGDIVATMVRRFRQEARSIGLLGTTDQKGTDVHRIVTIASIVEKETAAPEERPIVASVYYNRLARKMALDADPSVIYAALLAGKYDGTIYKSDLQLNSPYNTYKHAGLPPGPIGNPGRASLEAAMHPANTQYLFFVSDNNGHHRFARTLEEHSRNVALYRRAIARANR